MRPRASTCRKSRRRTPSQVRPREPSPTCNMKRSSRGPRPHRGKTAGGRNGGVGRQEPPRDEHRPQAYAAAAGRVNSNQRPAVVRKAARNHPDPCACSRQTDCSTRHTRCPEELQESTPSLLQSRFYASLPVSFEYLIISPLGSTPSIWTCDSSACQRRPGGVRLQWAWRPRLADLQTAGSLRNRNGSCRSGRGPVSPRNGAGRLR